MLSCGELVAALHGILDLTIAQDLVARFHRFLAHCTPDGDGNGGVVTVLISIGVFVVAFEYWSTV